MGLFQYRQQTQRLLNDAGVASHAPADLDYYINQARGQIAGEAECIANYATLAVDGTTQQYPFSAVTLSAGTTGVAGILNVRKAGWIEPNGGGAIRLAAREWEWFQSYVLSQTPPVAGQPQYWAQLGQGAAGTVFVNLPDGPYTLALDTVCYPSPLAADTDPEALPYQWTDAVPFYAAYLGLLFSQNAEGATAMYKLFELYMQRARGSATPSVLPHQYRGGPDPVVMGRLGIQPTRGQQQ